MPIVTNNVREQVVTKASSKGFFRRIAEKIGLAQREVAECKGKSLSDIAEMTSKKDSFELTQLRYNSAVLEKKNRILEGRNIKKAVDDYERYVSDTKKELEQVQDLYTEQRRKVERIKKSGSIKDTHNDYTSVSGDCYERGFFETTEGFQHRLENEEQKLEQLGTRIRTLRNRLKEEESLLEKHKKSLEIVKNQIDEANSKERALYGEMRNL